MNTQAGRNKVPDEGQCCDPTKNDLYFLLSGKEIPAILQFSGSDGA
jgi:hypothetical protein